VGRFLRRWSLDEPAAAVQRAARRDVTRGPAARSPGATTNKLEDWHRKRNLVLPGMTGPVAGPRAAQSSTSTSSCASTLLYLERWSVFLDLTIMLKTIPAVIRARGAW